MQTPLHPEDIETLDRLLSEAITVNRSGGTFIDIREPLHAESWDWLRGLSDSFRFLQWGEDRWMMYWWKI